MRKVMTVLALAAALVAAAAFVPAAQADTALYGTLIDPSTVDTGSNDEPILADNKAAADFGICETELNSIALFPQSFQGTAEHTCFADFDVWINSTLCLQRGVLGVWTNVTCTANAGWDALPNGAYHTCKSAVLTWDWRVRVKVKYLDPFGTSPLYKHVSFKKSGKCY